MEDDPVMQMYIAQAIVIEKEAVIQQLRREKEEMRRDLQELRLQRGSSESQQEVWAAIREIREEQRQDKERVESTLRDIQETLEGMQATLESAESTRKFNELERRLDDIVTSVNTPEDNTLPEWETILVLGGWNEKESFLLNRKMNRWKTLDFPCGHSQHGAVILNKKLYITRGNRLLKLNSKMKWIDLAPMKQPRKCITNSCLVFQGCIWIFGRQNFLDIHKTVERYCPQANQWTNMPYIFDFFRCAAAVCNGKIFVCGGGGPGGSELKSVECFDPASGIWTPLPDFPAIRSRLSMVFHEDRLLVFGGTSDGWVNTTYYKTVWTINPEEEGASWVELPPMSDARSLFTAVSYNDEIFAIGGYGDKRPLSKVEIFNGEYWREGPELPRACSTLPSLVIPSSLAVALEKFEK